MSILQEARSMRAFIEKAAQSLPSMSTCDLLVTIDV